MSTKALKRLQNEDPLQEILKKVGGADSAESDEVSPEEDSQPAATRKGKKHKKRNKQINRFDLLNEENNEDDEELQQILKEEEDLGLGLVDELNPLENGASKDENVPEDRTGDNPKKKKKKKRRKGKENKAEIENGEIEDEIDASVREVNMLLGDIGTAGDDNSMAVSQITYSMKALLSVEHKHLIPENEMRRIFGSRVIQAEQRRNRNRQRIHHKTSRLAQPKDTWAPYSKTGLTMNLLENRRGYQYFEYEHNAAYREVQFLFLDAVESLNPQNIVELLHLHPYHIGGLIQLCEIFRMSEDMAAAAELIEKALFAFECAFHPLFSLTSGNCRLDYRQPENRGFFLCLFKHLINVGQKGCYRTALELSKLLLSLEADDDPLCVLLCIDFYALRSEQYEFLIRLYEEWEAHRNLSQLPNFGFSIPLAKFHLANTDDLLEKADELLQHSLLMYPGFLMPMVEKCGITPDPTVTGHHFFQYSAQTSQTESLKQLITLYVHRTYSCWKEPEVMEWLEKNVRAVLTLVDNKDSRIVQYKQLRLRRYQGTPRNILRHIILSEIKDVTAHLPPELANIPMLSYDPLPPTDTFETYQRPGRPTQAQEASNPLSLFLRSLLPNFNANEPVPEVEDIGAVGGGDETRNNLQQGVGALMTAMRDLLNNIRPIEPPIENQHNGQEDYNEEDEEYIYEGCNRSSVIDTTLLLETSKSLSYPPLMNCYHTVNVASGYKVHVSVERFELEEKVADACVDYLILYDGADKNAVTLNSDVTCGKTAPENLTSSSNILTFYFKSDHSSALRGFAFIVTPVSDVPCSSSQLQCNNSLCLDVSLKCDSYNQCGDKTDESDCQVTGSSKIDESNTTLIIGLVIGITVLVAIIVAIVINVYKNNKWKRFLNQHLEDPDVWNASPSYPVTKTYFKSGRGNYNTLSNENYNEVTLQPHSEESIHNGEL